MSFYISPLEKTWGERQDTVEERIDGRADSIIAIEEGDVHVIDVDEGDVRGIDVHVEESDVRGIDVHDEEEEEDDRNVAMFSKVELVEQHF